MPKFRIKQYGLPINECPVDECPQYCRQWDRYLCQDAFEAGLECGLCKNSTNYMKPQACCACSIKRKD